MAKILIVDDEQSLLLLLQQIVEEQGHEVFMAENGRQAVGLLETQHPQLVISDVMMPFMDGYQLLHHIKSQPNLQTTKIALISAAPISKQTPYQADDYLAKPYDLITIEDLLERLV